LTPEHEKCREIVREFDLTALQGHPRSSILGVNGKPICDFLLHEFNSQKLQQTVKSNNFSRILPCLTHPLGGNPLEFLMKLTPQKLERWSYRMVKIS